MLPPVFKRRKPDGSQIPDKNDELPLPGRGQDDAAHASGATSAPADNGLGVPPFRPNPFAPKAPSAATSQEASMGRPPFPNTPATPSPNSAPANPNTGLAPALPGARPAARGERRPLVVGRGISLQGVVQDAERLVVEGTVEATMIHATELAVSPGGTFKGEIEVEDAEVAGLIDGTLTVRGNLIVRATGRVLGTARCRRLQVEDGGQITGHIEMITEPVREIG